MKAGFGRWDEGLPSEKVLERDDARVARQASSIEESLKGPFIGDFEKVAQRDTSCSIAAYSPKKPPEVARVMRLDATEVARGLDRARANGNNTRPDCGCAGIDGRLARAEDEPGPAPRGRAELAGDGFDRVSGCC